MGGGRKQFQVQIDQDALVKYGITIDEVRQAVESSNQNATGGYLNQRPYELLVRAIGRIQTIDDLKNIAVAHSNTRPVALSMIADVIEAPQAKRGDAAAYVREDDGHFSGGSGGCSNHQQATGRRYASQSPVKLRKLSKRSNHRSQPEFASNHFTLKNTSLTELLKTCWKPCVMAVSWW